jgi:hypothetical protein
LKIHLALEEEISSGHLEGILVTNEYIPFVEYGISRNSIKNYIVEDLRNSLNKNSLILLAEEGNNIVGLLNAGKSEWDSKHFEVNIGNIRHLFTAGTYFERRQRTEQMLSYLKKKIVFDLLITKSHTEDTSLIHGLESNSFQLMDTLVTYFFDFKNQISNFQETCKIEPLKDETSELKKLAKESFSETRVATDHFHADHRLDESKSDSLYEDWVENASRDKQGVVLVAKMDNRVVGFTTCNINYALNRYSSIKVGSLILSAVSPEYRQAQVYTSMIQAGLRWLSDKVDIADLGTHIGNYSVQRAWSRLGFRIVRSQHTWHKWYI